MFSYIHFHLGKNVNAGECLDFRYFSNSATPSKYSLSSHFGLDEGECRKYDFRESKSQKLTSCIAKKFPSGINMQSLMTLAFREWYWLVSKQRDFPHQIILNFSLKPIRGWTYLIIEKLKEHPQELRLAEEALVSHNATNQCLNPR